MKQMIFLLIAVVTLASCEEKKKARTIEPVNWQQRTVGYPLNDSLESGSTYLSVYSQIYSQSERSTHDLTVTISMRNTSRSDTLYLLNAEYYDTQGNIIRSYLDKPIFLAPMETIEIVIGKVDNEGGTGANFIFDWKIRHASAEPLFEGIMISTSGQQGLSFITQGKRID